MEISTSYLLLKKYIILASIFCLFSLIKLPVLADNYQANYPANSPYNQSHVVSNTLFSHYSEQPKHLDPAKAYSADQILFIAQIYEPLYQYHYLLRPYQLEPLSSDGFIKEEFIYKNQDKSKSDNIIYTTYTIRIKSDIFYQPHPGFAKNKQNDFIYHNLNSSYISTLDSISDIKLDLDNPDNSYSRELEAQDFVYQIKRMADPKVASPIYGLMANYIVGLDKLNKLLLEDNKNNNYINLNNNKYNIDGLRILDKYTFQIKIHGKYPQFKYWLAMTFFSPMPWEVDKFYSQEGLKEQNISLDTYPIGTGPFMLIQNNPNDKIILVKNPNYNKYKKYFLYPTQGMPDDKANGLLDKAGQELPLIDRAEYILEKESIPIWNKFLQGYYDISGISSDNFDQAIDITNNQTELTEEMKEKNINLLNASSLSVFYWGFNMLDPVVGGNSERARLLRRAISIAFDIEEYLNIFRNNRGIIAHSPIPPGINGSEFNDKNKNYNKYLYNNSNNKKNIQEAKKLLKQAGYPNGIDKDTGEVLIINYDAVSSGGPSDSALFKWIREQFDKIDIKLNLRITQYNRYQQKMRTGRAQFYFWGWNADYPDPENFLFLFLCEQSKVNHNGENASNYCNSEYDQLFAQMQNENDESKKLDIISKMVDILRYDNPWIFGFYNEEYILSHAWNGPIKPLVIGNNSLKYRSIDYKVRESSQIQWNQANYWPIVWLIALFLVLFIPVSIGYYRKIHSKVIRLD